MINKLLFGTLSLVLVLVSACQPADNLFEKIDAGHSGINFDNKIDETIDANYFQYMYMYIGGGVATADFNKDGLEDLFFVSNSFDNKLYLNKGDFKFEDISQQAGIVKRSGFDVGAAVADVNNDGWLDIYITRGGWKPENDGFANMLYINNGIQKLPDGTEGITFTEKAKEYGLDDSNRGVAASFFDYDRDGDLDVYISNTPDFEDKGNLILDLAMIQKDPKTLELKGSDKLYQNDGKGHFSDVSISAGIMPDIGFGLSPQVGDLNNDGWLDIYVCNDFRIPDFVYINQQNGTFKENRNEMLQHISFNSMGVDMGDINNDGFMDLYTLDMNPEDYVRAKTTMGMTPQYQFELMVEKNYHHQYMHNMLQLNNGDGTFSEIANMAGVANTDWSWSCLFADFDLDGYNDIYVSNGVFRDVIDRDVNNEILQTLQKNGTKPTAADFLSFTKKLPQQKLDNYFYKNNRDLTFENVSQTWTKSSPTFSNGATYADLDNDGDLDVIVSNINEPATLLKNTAVEQKKGSFLKIKMEGSAQNPQGIGATVKLYHKNGEIQTRQLITTRGFLSSVSPILHFGLKTNEEAVDLEVVWGDGKTQKLKSVKPNQVLKLNYAEAKAAEETNQAKPTPFLFTQAAAPFRHIDSTFNDFEIQQLLPHKLSQTGPALAKGDANGDGYDDVYLGGGAGQAGRVLLSDKKGGFSVKTFPDFAKDAANEDVSAAFMDVDSDGDMDLYVAGGSYEFDMNSNFLIGRMYRNDGVGNFERVYNWIPTMPHAAGVVAAADYDQDGDIDVFIGSRVVPEKYPLSPTSYLMINQENRFMIETATFAPQLERIGMVTDAVWEDIDQDKDLDLIVTGEWMGIYVFENQKGQLSLSSKSKTLTGATGWWNKLLVADIDGDGDKDIVAGNLGLNSRYKASSTYPFQVYGNDYDNNGIVDVVLANYYKDKLVPVKGRVSILKQIPKLATDNRTFREYASKDLNQIFGEELKSATHFAAKEFRSGIFINDGKGDFGFKAFDNSLQRAPINSILYEDFDGDGIKDLLMAGNNYVTEVETTRNDAGIGLFMKGKKGGVFELIPNYKTGFWAKKDVRNMIKVKSAAGPLVVVANNNDVFDFFYLKK